MSIDDFKRKKIKYIINISPDRVYEARIEGERTISPESKFISVKIIAIEGTDKAVEQDLIELADKAVWVNTQSIVMLWFVETQEELAKKKEKKDPRPCQKKGGAQPEHECKYENRARDHRCDGCRFQRDYVEKKTNIPKQRKEKKVAKQKTPKITT